MKADRVIVAMIVATTIFVTPKFLQTSYWRKQVLRHKVRRMEEIPVEERQVQRQTMSPRGMMNSKAVLRVLQEERQGLLLRMK
jgi:hypothetical protein